MSEELRPCPFCGSEQPQDSKDDGNVPYEFGMSRSCKFCSAAVNLGWNTRPIEDALHARIADLESLVEQLIWVGNDLLVSNTNPVTITLFNGLICNANKCEE